MPYSPPESAWAQPLATESETRRIAGLFAAAVKPPCAVYLRGDLGVGKTAFVRGFVQALGYSGHVKSPTYGLLENYAVEGAHILHLDLYRIEDPEELEFLGLRDLFGADSVLMVEWPERGGGMLPAADLLLEFGDTPEGRSVRCTPLTTTGRLVAAEVLDKLR